MTDKEFGKPRQLQCVGGIIRYAVTETDMRRRSYVAFLAAGLAGCGGTGGQSGTSSSVQTTDSTPTQTASQTPTATETPTPTASPSPTPTETPTPTPVPTVSGVSVLLTEAPNGLRKYKLTVSTSGDGTISSVTPELLSGNQFQVTSGGEGSSAVAVRGADLVDSVGEFSESRTLITVDFEEPVPVPELTHSVATLVDDDGNQMDVNLVDVETETSG